MVDLLVAPQVGALRESPAALRADGQPQVPVPPGVLPHGARVTEAQAVVGAEGLLPLAAGLTTLCCDRVECPASPRTPQGTEDFTLLL